MCGLAHGVGGGRGGGERDLPSPSSTRGWGDSALQRGLRERAEEVERAVARVGVLVEFGIRDANAGLGFRV